MHSLRELHCNFSLECSPISMITFHCWLSFPFSAFSLIFIHSGFATHSSSSHSSILLQSILSDLLPIHLPLIQHFQRCLSCAVAIPPSASFAFHNPVVGVEVNTSWYDSICSDKYYLKILATRCLLRLQCIEEHSRYVTVRGFLEKWTLRRHGGGRLSEDPGLKCQLSTIAVDRRALRFAYI